MTHPKTSKSESFVLGKLSELELSPEQYIVVGSGVLDVLGIRRANDIDFVTTPETFNELSERGWEAANNSPSLIKDDFEVYLAWDSVDGEPNFGDLMSSHQAVEKYNFVKLDRLLDWKRRVARPKDLKDVELIEKFLKNKQLNIFATFGWSA